jgi:hypothetical protein
MQWMTAKQPLLLGIGDPANAEVPGLRPDKDSTVIRRCASRFKAQNPQHKRFTLTCPRRLWVCRVSLSELSPSDTCAMNHGDTLFATPTKVRSSERDETPTVH